MPSRILQKHPYVYRHQQHINIWTILRFQKTLCSVQTEAHCLMFRVLSEAGSVKYDQCQGVGCGCCNKPVNGIASNLSFTITPFKLCPKTNRRFYSKIQHKNFYGIISSVISLYLNLSTFICVNLWLLSQCH